MIESRDHFPSNGVIPAKAGIQFPRLDIGEQFEVTAPGFPPPRE